MSEVRGQTIGDGEPCLLLFLLSLTLSLVDSVDCSGGRARTSSFTELSADRPLRACSASILKAFQREKFVGRRLSVQKPSPGDI
jgi:hypothetical protein